jgi:hypothetical protein
MALYARQFVRLIDGRSGNVAAVAHLPVEIGVIFSAQTNVVSIERTYARKIVGDHQIKYDDFEYIQKAIDFGYVFQGRDHRYLEFVYIETKKTYKHYLLVLKVARYGLEIWVQTFHRIDEGRLRSKIRKLRMIRLHD